MFNRQILKRLNVDGEVVLERIPHYVFIILAHISLIYLIYTLDLNGLLIAYLMSLPLTHIGVSFLYHRVLTHNAVKIPKWLEYLLSIYAGFSGQGGALSWVTVHNAHHKYSGTDKDPHSPYHSHWLSVQLLGYTFKKVSGRHAGRLLKDKFHLFIHNNYWKIYIPLHLILLLILGLHHYIVFILAPIAITWQLQSLANTWGHGWGLKDDNPRNSPLLFIFIFGDAWHKNHHDKPGSVRFHKYDFIGAIAEKLFKS